MGGGLQRAVREAHYGRREMVARLFHKALYVAALAVAFVGIVDPRSIYSIGPEERTQSPSELHGMALTGLAAVRSR